MATRKYHVERIVSAGCFHCSGYDVRWVGNNAQGVAARHHDSTGHQTWVEVQMKIYYGQAKYAEPNPQRRLGL